MMNQRLFTGIIFMITICANIQAQTDTWKVLSKISYKKEFDDMMGFRVDKPVFSPEIQALNGKEITLKGYIIPIEGYKSHKEFIFSAFPYASCFFCGAAGPETIMEVVAKDPIKYTEEAIIIKGKLTLNPKDINKLMYRLSEVEKLK